MSENWDKSKKVLQVKQANWTAATCEQEPVYTGRCSCHCANLCHFLAASVNTSQARPGIMYDSWSRADLFLSYNHNYEPDLY